MKSNDALLYAKTRQHKRRVDEARRIVSSALATAESRWYVAFSGGKDSTCLLSLVREQAPSTVAVSSIQEWRLPETSEYLGSIANLALTASGSDHGTGWSPNWENAEAIPPGVLWLGAKIGDDDQTIKNYGRSENGVFIGLRADENARRKVHIRKAGALFFNSTNQVWQAYPIAHWSVMDVWAFILANGIDYNHAYDRMTEIGVPLEQQRIGPLAIESVLGYGQLAILKRGWPELFNQFSARHPEARNYV
jgi:3'-phosphoadenosine 5'-phosphosulfate sulfotransferase (PAPS reductase)/FAD synthetase